MTTNKHCLICNTASSQFLATGSTSPILKQLKVVGGGYREDVVCPNCKSNDRERLLHLYLLHKTSVFTSIINLLHIAPERRLTNLLKQLSNLTYTTADLDMDFVDIKLDITNIPFKSNTFDFIVCNHVLEHILDDIKAMSELYRILKPNCQAILQVPISHIITKTYEDNSIVTEWDRDIAFGQYDHVRIYADDYIDRLKQVGFKVAIYDWFNKDIQLFGGQDNIYRLNNQELIYTVTK